MLRNALVKVGYAALRAGVRAPELSWLTRFSEQGYLIDLMNKLRINCVLDVGANKGWFANHLRMAGYQGYILCFEPLRENYESISRLREGDASWLVFNFALGSECTIKSFNVILQSGETVLSSLLKPKIQSLVHRTESVEVKRLDAVLDNFVRDVASLRIFLKMDTQGFDLEVLRGVGHLTDKISLLQSELSVTPIYDDMPHYTQALEYYESLGFALMNLYIVNRAGHGGVLEYDCLMARVDQFEL